MIETVYAGIKSTYFAARIAKMVTKLSPVKKFTNNVKSQRHKAQLVEMGRKLEAHRNLMRQEQKLSRENAVRKQALAGDLQKTRQSKEAAKATRPSRHNSFPAQQRTR